MAISATTLALIGAGVAAAGATAGAAGSSANRKKARNEEAQSYRNAKSYLDSLYYRDPLTTVGNRSLLKAVQENHRKELDALQNRAVAGGATVENALAARQKSNESMDKVYGQLLQNEDARRDRISAQKMSLDQQHSQNIQNGYYQAAQDWQSWGGQIAQAGMSLMNAGLLGGGELSAKEWAKMAPEGDVLGAMARRTENEMFNPMMQPITDVGGLKTPGVTGPKGGLAGR